MPDFAINPFEVTNFRILGKQDRNKLKTRVRQHAKQKRTVLIVPLLASEFTHPENRPVLENMLANLRQVTYLHRMVFGLDNATEDEAWQLMRMIKNYDIKNYLIQWNQGPVFSRIYDMLADAGFDFKQQGKGKNMFLGFGIAMAMGADCVGLVDADIRGFDRVMLDRLLYPVVVLDYDFAKAYYTRVTKRRMYGRVKRLLLDPLLLSLKRRFMESNNAKVLGLIDFLMAFEYQLSGEVAFEHDLLRKMRFATNWGVEIFTLAEVYRKAASAAQVEVTQEPFDHKHQKLSENDENAGLYKMGIDIVTTLMNTLVREEGLEISDTFFRDLSITYVDVAETMVKKYSDQASFSNLIYDRDAEEAAVGGVFRKCILRAGEMLTSQARLTENFLRIIHTYPEFKPFVRDGLAEAILNVEKKMDQDIFDIPQTVSWERVYNKLPNMNSILMEAVKRESEHFG